MKSNTTKSYERDIKNIQARIRRGNGYNTHTRKPERIMDALAKILDHKKRQLVVSRENDVLYGVDG